MPSTVHKRLLGVASAAFVGLLAAGPAQAAAAPKIKAAYTVDADRDGHVDGVSLEWSKKVRGGADSRAPFAFRVAGHRVTRALAPRGKSQRLHVAENPECDAGGSIRIAYSRPASAATRIRAARGRTLARSHRVDMRRFDSPVPRITCAVTLDSDGDARVDGVRVTYSRAVRNQAQRSGRFLFSVPGYRVTAVDAARGRFLAVHVAEGAAPDSGAKPSVAYRGPRRKSERPYAVRSGRTDDAFTGIFQSTRDGVSPRLVAAATADADRDGLLDGMSVRFSEPVRTTGGGGIAVLGMKIRSIRQAGAAVDLSLVEGTARGDARPGVWVAAAGTADLSGNAALRAAVSPIDRAAPLLTAALTQDTGGVAGRIDAVAAVFSEPVAHARDAGGAYPFQLAGRRVTAVEAASGRFVQVRIAEAAAADSGDRPSVRYIPGSGVPVADASGNPVVDGLVNPVDGVAPVLLSATTADGDGNGQIDGTTLTFSEEIRHGAETGGSSFSVAGHEVASAGAASGREIQAALVEAGTADSGARPAVTYTRNGIEDVRDDAGNRTATTTIAQAADGARPVLLSARTADADDDGRLDRVETAWSEPLDHADAPAGPFRLSAAGFTVTRVRAADGAALTLDLTEPAAHDTGSTPAISYGGSGAAVRDAAGLEPAQSGWTKTARDALAPRLVSAATGDGDADGSIDSIALRFSENVLHARETAPAGSFSAGGLALLSAEAAAGDTVELKLEESGIGDSGLRPAVAYSPDAQEDIRDAAGNLAPSSSLAQSDDGARPVLMGAATADADSDGRLDRVSTNWSEPLDHADDAAAPFPLSVEQLDVTRVRAASGQTLDIDLAEPSSPDTGSAPDVTYAGGADPVRDANGLEAAQKVHSGLTRDALPPRLVSTATSDADFNGKLDRVEIEWSEQVTGSTATSPYVVAGRTLGANASFSGARTRVPFAENPTQFDTHDTPLVSYDPGVGDLADIPEGVGDVAEDAPAVEPQAALDRAAPVIVAAKTADLTTPVAVNAPNGTIDAMLVTFSEPISHAVDGLAPFSLNVAGRIEVDVEGDAGSTDRTLYVRVSESSAPDGGETPSVSVQAIGPLADRIKDRAPTPNEALPMTFSGTADEVSPVLMSAQLGERGTSGGCTKNAVAGIDGKVDCVLTTWSEDVEHAADTTPPYSLSSSGWAIDAGGIGALPPARTLEVPLTPSTVPDRDRTGTTVSYNGSEDTPVVDDAATANEALDGTKSAEAACRDTGREPNDSRVANDSLRLLAASPAFERKCAFDEDWFIVTPSADGYLDIATRPVGGLDVQLEVFAGSGATPLTPATSEPGGSGEVDRLRFSGLAAGPVYWARVTANDTLAPQEGPYCVVYSVDVNAQASCGPLAGQIVFTEVGFGNDKFVEIKNDFEVPVEMRGANAKLVIGTGTTRACDLVMPTTDAESIIQPDEHVLIGSLPGPDVFGCNEISSLAPGSEQLQLVANGAIDLVPFSGIFNSPVAAEHSLQFVESTLDQDHTANDLVKTRWCRTFAAHSKRAAGDGCDEYRINEVLWRPTSGTDGAAFVELAGNIPALADSELLGGWVLRGVNGLTGEGSADFVLPAGASPRPNGTYVIADGTAGGQTVVGDFDIVWDGLNLHSTAWPDGATAPGPRGIQLLLPDPRSTPPCPGSADAFGWTTTAQGFAIRFDNMRSCPSLEGQEYTTSTTGVSAARDNLSSGSDTTYNVANDSGNNRVDFCPQAPNPGQLNVGRIC